MASTKIPTKLQKVIEEVDEISNCIDQLRDSCESLRKEIQESLSQDDKIRELQTIINKINESEKTLFYLNALKSAKDVR